MAVKEVEAAQDRHPPVAKLVPQGISFADIQAGNLFGAGCAYYPGGGEGGNPVLLTDSERGVLKLGGELTIFASDAGSAEFPYGTREKYTGRTYEIALSKGPGEGTPYGEEAVRWPGTMTVRDQWGRIAYDDSGTLECGA